MKVEGGKIGYHSGMTGGIIPETFRVARILLNRLDDPDTGVVCKELFVDTPATKQAEADNLAKLYGDKLYTKYDLLEGVEYVNQGNPAEAYLNGVWRPNLAITGVEGLPPLASAGNVLRP